MRMWMVDPETMCRKHLLGEHVEIHMLIGALRKGKPLHGFTKKGLLEFSSVGGRHDQIVLEMESRGYVHRSPLGLEPEDIESLLVWARKNDKGVDRENSLLELHKRCPECKALWEEKNEKSTD